MDFNTAHDIVHNTAGASEYCGSCNGTLDKNATIQAAGTILKAKHSRPNSSLGYYGSDKGGELDADKRDDLKDSQFAYVDSNGGKHLPIHDAAHVRNALARFNQTKFDSTDDKSKAMAKIKSAATKFGVNVSDDEDDKKAGEFIANASVSINKRKVYAFSEITAGEDGKLPDKIQIMPIGEWDTVPYGKLIITSEDLHQMADNFKKGIRAGVPIDIDHDGKAAAGWINSLSVEKDGLYAAVEWTPLGVKMLGEKQYRFFSPEFNPEYIDPENKHLQLDNVLIAGSLVNRPLFKELKPLFAHEGKTGLLTKQKTLSMLFIEPMNIDELLKKRKAGETLTASEQDFVKSYFANDSKKGDDTGDDDEEDKGKRKGEGDSEGDSFKKSDKAAPGDKAKTMDELGGKTAHTISASELTKLKEDAEAGRKAAQTLEFKEIEDQVSGWTFSDKGGHFQPALKDGLISFVKSLSVEQRKVFGELVDKMPEQHLLFKEKGSNEVLSAGQQKDEMTIAANELVEKSKGADGKPTLSFSEAVKKISQDPKFASNVAAYDYHKGGVAGE